MRQERERERRTVLGVWIGGNQTRKRSDNDLSFLAWKAKSEGESRNCSIYWKAGNGAVLRLSRDITAFQQL